MCKHIFPFNLQMFSVKKNPTDPEFRCLFFFCRAHVLYCPQIYMDDVIIGCFTVFYKIAKPSIRTEPVLHKSVHRPHNKSSFTQQKPCSFSMFLFSVNPFAAVNVSSQKQSGDKIF